MKRLIISVLLLMLLTLILTSCATSRKSHNELKGLMLLNNLQLNRNKAFYSRHNIKTRNEAFSERYLVKMIYPGHGKPFPVEVMKKSLAYQ